MLAIGLPFVGIGIAAENAYGGAGKNVPPMVLHLVDQWGVTIPVMYVLGEIAGFGPTGMMLGSSLASMLAGVAAIWLVRRGTWLTHAV